jgi:hypothetical protein
LNVEYLGPPRGMGGPRPGMGMQNGRGSGRGRFPPPQQQQQQQSPQQPQPITPAGNNHNSQSINLALSQEASLLAGPPQNQQVSQPPSSQEIKPVSEKPVQAPQPQAAPQQKPPQQNTPAPNNVVVSQSQPPMQNQNPGHPGMQGSRGGPRGRGMMAGRGGMGRGRGGYNSMQGPPRQQFDTRQPSNTTTVTPIKRGGMYNGPPGPKRGRFEQGPPSRQGMPPKPHYMNPPPSQIPHANSYGNVQPPMHNAGYQDPNQHSQFVDQYSHSGYSAPMPAPQQSSYMPNNGYQNSYGNGAASQMGYSQTTEYDHSASGYQDYK